MNDLRFTEILLDFLLIFIPLVFLRAEETFFPFFSFFGLKHHMWVLVSKQR